jgi:hypothetical protein
MLKAIVALDLFFHLLLPPFLLFWIAKTPSKSKASWWSVVALSGVYLLLMGKAGVSWAWFGFYWPWIFAAAFILVVILSRPGRQALPLWPQRGSSWALLGLTLGAFIFVALGLPPAFMARSYPKNKVIDLIFPLRHGVYSIGHGGSNETMNQHFKVPAQRYALDILKLNSFGVRAKGLWPRDLSRYAIFEEEVLAPCSGEVIRAESDWPDHPPPKTDKLHLLGNHVVIFCDESSLLLAHLRQHSLQVETGDYVEAGEVVAQVGNSGNTSEPHLHMHAVAGRHSEVRELAASAEGVPMTFENRFLIRNDRVVRE